MTTIDLIVLGIVKEKALSAYDIQKQVEYRNISKWVKISTPSIYKKVIKLEEKGFIQSKMVKEGKMPEKAVYSLTEEGEKAFETLMLDISAAPINIFLDFNAVIVNLESLSTEQQKICLASIGENVSNLKMQLEENILAKKDLPVVSETGKAVLQQQFILVEAIEKWLESLNSVF